jgi:transketolase C-terminal domain/subunit
MSKIMSVRNAYGEALVDCGAENNQVVVAVADVSSSVRTDSACL